MNEQPSTVPSAEFRRTFHRLSAPTIVTVNGHTIGTWLPAGTHVAISTMTDSRTIDAIRPGQPVSGGSFGHSVAVPKPGAKR